jgi:hypothetical protein
MRANEELPGWAPGVWTFVVERQNPDAEGVNHTSPGQSPRESGCRRHLQAKGLPHVRVSGRQCRLKSL